MVPVWTTLKKQGEKKRDGLGQVEIKARVV